MMAVDDSRLNSREVQAAIGFVLRKASSQQDAERGALAAAISVCIATRGPAATVELFRDLADMIERDELLESGEWLQ